MDHKPGNPAPATCEYELLNLFGSRTGMTERRCSVGLGIRSVSIEREDAYVQMTGERVAVEAHARR
jgi:hypothetical protein